MTLFDFAPYLSAVLSVPTKNISVQPLDGGLTNFTVRATFTPPASLSQFSQSRHLSSVVLKYAPPFVAADPSQSRSVHRQVVEAQALALLSGGSIATISEVLSRFPTIRIPKLIHHDTEQNVLWMTDLEDTLTLSRYLATNPPSSTVERIAAQLGEFLSEFFSATSDPSDDSLPPVGAHTEETYSFLASVTKKILARAGNAEAERLAKRVSEGLKSIGTVEPCLGMVDLWPGSILIDSRGDCGLVDWEYFGRSTASSELGMLGTVISLDFIIWFADEGEVAHLHLILLKSQTSAHESTWSFTTLFLESYFKRSVAPSLYFKRQVLLAYGRELVNNVEFSASELDEPSKQRALHLGIRSLTAAGNSENELDYSVFEEPDDALNRHIISMLHAK